ncbi:hypothetical protein ABW20_dc0109328 [Dactylellina cionopaga]|nr:hypothetical protein ABW20_dc0109328 [Dactylellina cionopaga]
MPLLNGLLASLPDSRIVGGPENPDIKQIYYYPNKVTSESAFVCLPRDQDETADRGAALAMVAEAVKRGASSIVADNEAAFVGVPDSVTKVLVTDIRIALAMMAAEFYGHPSRKMMLVGITGTNGKTTTANLIADVLRGSGRRFKSVGVIGTLGAVTETTNFNTGYTTPMSLDVQRLLAEWLENGVEAVVMEVSSHGLALRRVVGCAFDVGIFTNFTQDHLDFHETMEEYWAAKVLFFTEVAQYSLQFKKFAAVINADDEYGRKLVTDVINRRYPHITFSIDEQSDLKAENVQLFPSNIRFSVPTSVVDMVSQPGQEDVKGELVLQGQGDNSFDIALTGRFNA